MNKPLVLIINPLKSHIENQIVNSIISLEGIDYYLLDGNDFNSYQYGRIPNLVLILLDNCNGTNFPIWKFQDLFNNFPPIPILCVINTRSECKHCLKCKQIAWDFIPTPISASDIQLFIFWHLKNFKKEEAESIELVLKEKSLADLFVGQSVSSLNIKSKILKIAHYDVTVLLQGETGSGKELSAKLIHYLSNRSTGPFIAINCGAIPTELFENELFGHKKGAYTHADTTEKGVVQAANKGTLFFDEIESLPIHSQVKLLRFIEEKKYKPLGQSISVSSDVRIIAAANKDLNNLVKTGEFRDDLFYRLSVVNIEVSPLRNRKEDIPLLARHIVEKFSKLYSKKIIGITPEAVMYLTYYSWPGNIREMENMLQEAVILSSNNWIELDNLNFSKNNGDSGFKLESFQKAKNKNIDEFERKYLKSVLKMFNGNVSKASGFAKKDRREFYRLISKYKIEPNSYRLNK
ncbi:MAG: sigma-54 dependent transcriptional regulator [Ignavibacteriaceae bacterium]